MRTVRLIAVDDCCYHNEFVLLGLQQGSVEVDKKD